MNLAQLIQLARAAAQDQVAPYIWEDSEWGEFADDAQLEAARRAHLLVDSSSPAARAAITAGDPIVQLDPRVIFIRRARLASTSVPLRIRVSRRMDDEVAGWEAAQPSAPFVLIPDWETGAVRLYPPPAQDDELVLTVVREPLDEMAGDPAAEPEIPRRYHRSLIQWMLYRAYSKPDTQSFDKQAAANAEAQFAAEFGERSGAINEHWAAEQYYDVGDFQ